MKSRMRRLLFLLPAVCLMLAPAMAQDESAGQAGDAMSGMTWQQTAMTATVVDVDQDSNLVTLRGPEGNQFTMAVDQRVDLSDIEQGDEVNVEFFQSVALELREPTEQEMMQPLQVLEERARAPEGTQPAGGGLRQIRAVMTVNSVDLDEWTLTATGPRGNTFTLAVPDSVRLQDVSEGDTVVVTYTEALAVSLSKTQA